MQNITKLLGSWVTRSASRRRLPRDFDPALYLELNPDVRVAGAEPSLHYAKHGRVEGRAYRVPKLVPLKQGSGVGGAPILIVCHEASRSGAPILGLNLVRQLVARREVVALLLGEGPLVDEFTSAASSAFLCTELRFTPSDLAAMAVIDELCAAHAFAGAIVNSVECRSVLRGLHHHGVPTVTLLHEFAAYTRPASAFPRALFWSGKAVFSARITRDDAFQRLELRDAGNLAILAQGKCTVGPAEATDGSAAPRLSASAAASTRPLVHVLGVGHVQYRKGVDLFIECATRMRALDPGTEYRFHWVGGGYQPGSDLTYSAYLADQIRRAGLGGSFEILGETDRLEDVYAQAQLFLLTSRLDPLPNVAIDAATQGLPVLCFDETTGIADFLVEAGLGAELVARYVDTSDMAAKAAALGSSPELRARVSSTLKARADAVFSMPDYVHALDSLLAEAGRALKQEAQDTSEILRGAVLRQDVCVHPAHPQLGERLADGDSVVAATYVRSWASGLYRRKPFAGFHPGIYAEKAGLGGDCDPLANFLRRGRPDGAWSCPVITPAHPVASRPQLQECRIALHVHAYYVELLEEIVHRLGQNSLRPDLFVTIAGEPQQALAIEALKPYPGRVRIDVAANRGRDIGPFLSTVAAHGLDRYQLIGHLHTKKSVDVDDRSLGSTWYRFLLENLVGSSRSGPMLDRIVSAMLQSDGPAMVFPEDPYVFGDDGNAAEVAALAARAGWPVPPRAYRFPVGSMFLARPAALRPLLDLGLTLDDYPEEPLAYDGTILHALERFLGLLGSAAPGGLAVTNIPGVTR